MLFKPDDYNPEQNLWKRNNRKELYKTRIFDLVSFDASSPDGSIQNTFYHLESIDWVNVIALTDSGNVVLVDQFRHGLNRYSLELPGGLAEKNSLLESVQAELREETGYEAKEWQPLGKVSANPAIFSNFSHTFLARGAHKVSDQDLDPNEDIRIFEYPIDEIPELIERGFIHHGMMVASFGLYFMKQL